MTRKSDFDHLLDRYAKGELSAQENAKVEAWLKMRKAERNTELSLSDEDKERLFRRITHTVDNVDDVIATYPRKPVLVRLFRQTWLQVAATVVVLLSISFGIWNIVSQGNEVDRIASDREKVILNDGSIVWLTKGSKVSYYEKQGIRHAFFEGEALFEVAKNPASQFIISYGNIRVKVLGTSFHLKTTGDSVELKVLTGKVNLSSPSDSTGVNVTPHQRVVYAKNGHAARSELSESEVTAITRGTQYIMNFNNTRMEEVLARIEKKFDVTIEVHDDAVHDCRITADMTDNSLERSLTMITDLLDVTYERDSVTIELSGKGCK